MNSKLTKNENLHDSDHALAGLSDNPEFEAFIGDILQDFIDMTLADLASKGIDAAGFQVDITSEESVQAMIDACMEKYGTDAGPLQEKESEALLRPFLKEFRLPKETEERIIFLVSHHHTYAFVDGMDWQILLEADFLVNADESRHSRSSIDKMTAQVFRTNTGKHLLSSIYQNVK